MPELPEVETVRRSLHGAVAGRAITGIRPGTFPAVMGGEGIEAVAARVVGRRITDIRRRGKYLFFALDDGTHLMVHLRMTGRLALAARDEPPLRFEHLALELDDGHDLRFCDQRKFGRVLHLLPADLRALEGRIGPEPLSTAFTAERLGDLLLGRTGKLKAVLLDQRRVAGLGNIYVDEALFRARLHPERAAGSLATEEVRRLHRAIRAVLREGLANRGTTFSTFQDGYGASGDNQGNLRVYGRARRAEPCPRCGRPLSLAVVAGRSTHFCATCQPSEQATAPVRISS
jgi:formamidopyrimidine-DNA glycosylase